MLEELEVSGVKDEVISGIKRVMKGVDNTAKDNLRRSFRNCLQVDVFINDTGLLEYVTSEWYSQQSQHVNSIVSTYTDKLATIISNAVQRGSLYKDVQKEVKNLYNITDNRAKFIARNEIVMNGALQKMNVYVYLMQNLMGIFFFGMIVKLEKSMVEKFIRLQSYIQEWIIDVGALPFQLLI